VYLVQKNHVRGRSKQDFALLRMLARLSKNLFNFTLYTTRQYHEETGKFLTYEQAYHVVKTNENYRLLPSQVAQQTMKYVHRAFKSFFGLLKVIKLSSNNNDLITCNPLSREISIKVNRKDDVSHSF
jgi:transposase